MRKYRFIPGAGVLALALIAMMNEDVPAVIGLILIIAAAILLIFASRGTVYFSKAVRAINSSEPGKKEKGVELMEKALKAGLSDENAVVAASVLLQNDNEEKAKEILEPLSMSKERKVAGPALSSLSMYYWLQKDYAKAIELCEKSKSIGYVSRNLCINLLTYYLAAGKTREFSELLDEMGTSGGSSPAIVDFVAVKAELAKKIHRQPTEDDLLGYIMYPKVFVDYFNNHQKYGAVMDLDTTTYYQGMRPGETLRIKIGTGKEMILKLDFVSPTDQDGQRTLFYELDGRAFQMKVKDRSVKTQTASVPKADPDDPGQVGMPLNGNVVKVNVKAGDQVKVGEVLLTTEAMKMESAVKAPFSGTVKQVNVKVGDALKSQDLLLTLEK